MPSRLAENTKSQVIQLWLKGIQRDRISADTGLSAGAVTNIVYEWKERLGFAVADELRELAVTLMKIGITPVQCANGFRAATMMNRLGVKEEDFETFMSETYNRCGNLGLTPESIASYLTDLLEFSKSVPITKVPDYIESKKEVKDKLEREIENLKDQKVDIEKQILVTNADLHDKEMTTARLKWYSDIKEELAKYGIPVDDISKLANVVNGIRQQGFDASKVLDEFSNLEMLRVECKAYQDITPSLKNQYDSLNHSFSVLQQEVSSHKQSITVYRELEAMGFGLKELKLLWHTINEITDANNIIPFESVQKFLKDIEEQYDDKLGFESKIVKLQDEVSNLVQQEARLRSQLLILPAVTQSLTRLLQRGVTEQDIVDIAELLRDNGSGGPNSISRTNESVGITIQEIQSLIGELRTYGSIKSTINQLSQKVEKLRNQVNHLRTEKRNLDAQIRTTLLALHYLEQLASFYRGSSVSLRSEIASLISTIAYIVHILRSETQTPPMLREDNSELPDSQFAPLEKATKGEEVNVKELKNSLAKAIETTQDKLNSSGKLDKILSDARLVLLEDSFQA